MTGHRNYYSPNNLKSYLALVLTGVFLGDDVIEITVLDPENGPSETSTVQILSSLVATMMLIFDFVAEITLQPAFGNSDRKKL
jgi:hypothetical protein